MLTQVILIKCSYCLIILHKERIRYGFKIKIAR